MEGVDGCLLSGLVPSQLNIVNVEDAAADSVVATGVRLVAVIVEAETTPFRLFLWGQSLQRRAILPRLGRAHWWCRRAEQRLPRRRHREQGTRGFLGGRWR